METIVLISKDNLDEATALIRKWFEQNPSGKLTVSPAAEAPVALPATGPETPQQMQ